ncbi:MAG: mycothione reductase [Actinomycetia bacterium]|nr:mycothione reductase [Actinomycetes bacterium]MCP4962650.1 mycothione reductase [Actinomycetes bacterium]
MNHFDMIIVGTGSGNSIPGPEFDDWKIAVVEKGAFGGTCLNVGCIPTKMFIYAADIAHMVKHSEMYGVDATLDGIRWTDVRDRVFGRIDPIAHAGEQYRVGEECPNITVFHGEGKFTDERIDGEQRVIEVNGQHLTAPTIVLGAGARPNVPPIPGIDPRLDLPVVRYETSDSVMRLDELPESMLVLGGGYVATEMGHVFSSFGVDVKLVNRGPVLLGHEDPDVARRFTEVYSQQVDVRTGTYEHEVHHNGDGVEMTYRCSISGELESVSAECLLLATGRKPNGDTLNLDEAGIEHRGWRVLVDDAGRTSAPGVWAFGDLSNELQLKHLANLEMRDVRHNILNPDDLRFTDRSLTPHAVFSHPQVAAVGMTEPAARDAGIDVMIATKDYGSTAAGWAMEDTTSFAKLIADRATRRLVGAHIMGPHAASLIQQLIQGMAFGQTVDQMASGMMYVHPALSEVIENALLDFSDENSG